MEEKERYEIHRYTLQANEKISFNDYTEHICEHYDFNFEKIKPFTTRIQDLLNQQDKRIKELEEENQQLKEKLNNFETCMKKYNVEDIEHLDLMLFVLSGETKYHLKEIKDKHKKELKQTQKQLAISELEKLKVKLHIIHTNGYLKAIDEEIDDQIKELKGEK